MINSTYKRYMMMAGLLLASMTTSTHLFAMRDAAAEVARNVERMERERAENLGALEVARADYARLNQVIGDIRAGRAQLAADETMRDLEGQLRDASNRLQRAAADQQGYDFGHTVVNTMFQAGMNRFNLETDKQKIKAQGEADAVKWKAAIETSMKEAMKPENLLKTIAAATGITLGAAGMYYLSKFGYEYAKAQIGKPSLVRETSRGSIAQSIRQQWNALLGREEFVDNKLEEIVLSPDMQTKALLLADDAKETNSLGLTYQNALFYGPPGTGKTEFAKKLARYSGMDYAILSGADFSQFKDGEAIFELHKLFDWGQTVDKGLIIFIDEADACFRDRATLSKEGVELVNAFLSRTGASSDKYMIILATNYENELDAAVRSRIHKKLPFLLPGIDERIGILKKKIEKYILNDSRQFERDGETVTVNLAVAADVNDAYMNSVARNIEGFSGRDIDQMVAEVRLRAYRSGQNVVTKDIFEKVVADKKATIEKDRQTTEYQRKKYGNAAA